MKKSDELRKDIDALSAKIEDCMSKEDYVDAANWKGEMDALVAQYKAAKELEEMDIKAAEKGAPAPSSNQKMSQDEIEKMLRDAREIGIEYALITNIGQIERVKKYGFKLVFDYRLNAFNGPCVGFLREQGCENVILAPELILAQTRDYSGFGLIVYGKIPVMTTHKCVIKDTVGCASCKTYIRDRQGTKMYAEGIYGHLNIIYNSVPIYMADKPDSISCYSQHFIFTDEENEECERIIDAYKKNKAPVGAFRRIK